jgi:hypothetical protein
LLALGLHRDVLLDGNYDHEPRTDKQ